MMATRFAASSAVWRSARSRARSHTPPQPAPAAVVLTPTFTG